MKKTVMYILLFLALIFNSSGIFAQIDTDKVCRIEDGQLIFTLDLRWTEQERKEVSELFDLDSALIVLVYKGEVNIDLDNEHWKTRKVSASVVELFKSVQEKNQRSSGLRELFNIFENWDFFGKDETTVPAAEFGVNNFKSSKIFSYENGVARFYLPGSETAAKVYISGTFNNWSTSQTPMKFTRHGWTIDLNLKPGKYEYKYIVDGGWTTDPENNLREKNDAGSDNSVVYCYNHVFRLKGHTDAARVVVTGNFYGWNPGGLSMNRTSDGWSLPVYLGDGTYAYKFIVDGEWITDPANPLVRSDASGNKNSFLSIGTPYVFKLEGFTSAEKVVLTGSFNGWNEKELVMDKTSAGWQLPYVIGSGNYEYKFIVDGKWITDPENPLTTGSGNYTNSFMALNANHIFELNQYPDAARVIVTGSFNNWSTEDYRMIMKNGKWIFPMYLQPGKYLYKFIVDGEWISDPANKLFEDNGRGSYNSVLWINRDE